MSNEHVMDLPQVGGSEEAFLAAKPILFSMGKSAIYCGGAGSGSVSYTLLIGTPKCLFNCKSRISLGFCY